MTWYIQIIPNLGNLYLKIVHIMVLKTSLVVSQYWFRQWLGVFRQQFITWTNVHQVRRHHMESTGQNDLILGMLFRYTRYITANHVVGPRGDLWKGAQSYDAKRKSIWIGFRVFYSRHCAKRHYAYFLFAAVICIDNLKWLHVWHGWILTDIFRYKTFFSRIIMKMWTLISYLWYGWRS